MFSWDKQIELVFLLTNMAHTFYSKQMDFNLLCDQERTQSYIRLLYKKCTVYHAYNKSVYLIVKCKLEVKAQINFCML